MRKLIHAAFVAFWVVIATLLILRALTDPNALEPRVEANTAVMVDAASDEPQRYSAADIARHDHLDDCWMAIEGGVYDLTDYVDRHPAPDEVLAPWCGREATEGMRTKGRGRDHSARAWRMLERYRIGELIEAETVD